MKETEKERKREKRVSEASDAKLEEKKQSKEEEAKEQKKRKQQRAENKGCKQKFLPWQAKSIPSRMRTSTSTTRAKKMIDRASEWC